MPFQVGNLCWHAGITAYQQQQLQSALQHTNADTWWMNSKLNCSGGIKWMWQSNRPACLAGTYLIWLKANSYSTVATCRSKSSSTSHLQSNAIISIGKHTITVTFQGKMGNSFSFSIKLKHLKYKVKVLGKEHSLFPSLSFLFSSVIRKRSHAKEGITGQIRSLIPYMEIFSQGKNLHFGLKKTISREKKFMDSKFNTEGKIP